MRWLNQSLFRRLLFSFFTIFILGIALIGIQISISTTDYLTNQQRQEMLRQARNVNATIQSTEERTANITQTIENLGQFSSYNIWLMNESGEIVAASSGDMMIGELIHDSLMEDLLRGQNSIQVMQIDEEERPMLSVAVPWYDDDEIRGGIILHSPIAGIKSTVRNIREIVLWAILGGLIIVGLSVSYLSWTISKPLRRVEEAANEIALGNYQKRVSHHLPDEVGELVKSFNRMTEKLDQIEKERDSLEQKRNDFIANISHELRTPLTAMKGFLEALQDGLVKDPESQQKYFNIMYRETEYLNHLVNDLMDLIKLEKNEVSLDLYDIHIREVIDVVVYNLKPSIKEKENKIHIHCDKDVPLILADSLRLEQIFKNIIHNANKFTENGSIAICITLEQNEVLVSITDNGIGIPSHDLARIWDRFFKVDRVRTKKGRVLDLG